MANPIPPPEILVEQLSSEGRKLLEHGQAMELSPEEFVEEMLQLGPKDRAVLWKINEYLLMAYEMS